MEGLPAVRAALDELRRDWGGQPPGECRLVREGQDLVVAQADPLVWIEDSFLRTLVGRKKNPWVTLMWGPVDQCDPATCCQSLRDGPHCFRGAILEIDGKNDKVFYRIGRYLRRGVWEASWK